jgi:hypothetical protein
MHAILLIIIWLSTGADVKGFQIEPARCETVRAEMIRIQPKSVKATVTCLYQDPAI